MKLQQKTDLGYIKLLILCGWNGRAPGHVKYLEQDL